MMKKDRREKREAKIFRQKAEDQIIKKQSEKAITPSEAETDTLILLHELEVHQIKLEMQNDELKLAAQKAETAVALYDFSPASYFTLNNENVICELNRSGTILLGKNRNGLIDRDFRVFITPDSVPVFNDFFSAVFETGVKQNCEIRLSVKGHPVFVYLEGIVSKDGHQCLLVVMDITERKLASEALQQSEIIYRSMFHQNPQPMLIFDIESLDILEVNEIAILKYGYTRKEFLALTLKDLCPASDIPLLLQTIANLTKLINVVGVFRHTKKSGEIIYVELTSHDVVFRNRKARHVLINEVSERIKAEKILANEASRSAMLLDLFRQAPDLSDKQLYDFGLDIAVKITESKIGFFHEISDDQQEIFLNTWNSEALKNCAMFDERHYPVTSAGNWADAVREKRPIIFNNFADSPNRKGLPPGHAPLTRLLSIPVIAGEKVRLIFGVGNKEVDYNESDAFQIQAVADELHKIIEKRKIERALLKSEEQFHLLFNASLDAILLTSPDSRIYDVNPSGCRMFDRSREEIIQLGRNGLVDASDPRLADALAERERTGKYRGELTFIRRYGTKFPVDISSQQFTDSDGTIRTSMIVRDISDRKLDEQIQVELTERLTAVMQQQSVILENANIGITLVIDRKQIWVNRKMEEMFQYTRKEMVGRNARNLYPSQNEFEAMGKNAYPLLAKGLPYTVEQTLLRRDGSSILCLFLGQAVDPDDLAKGIIWLLEDITERKKAEQFLEESLEKLKLSEKDLKKSQEIAKLGSWKWNIKTSEVEWSDTMFQIFGIEKNSYTGPLADIITKVIHPDDLHIVLPSNAKAFANKNPQEYRIVFPDKSIRHILAITDDATFDEPGYPSLITGTAQDITERKIIEIALKESEERWKFALEGPGDGLWDWNLETNEVLFSTQWKAMFGFEEHEISNQLEEWSKRIHPDDLQKCYADIQLHLDGKVPFYSNSHRVICKDGTPKWVLDRGKITKYDKSGKAVRMIGAHSDLTERMEMENQLKALNATKDKFFTIIAHDLRNPFNTIIGFGEIIAEQIKGKNYERVDKYAEIIQSASARAMALLTNLLEWSRLQIGQIEYRPELIDIHALINEVAEFLNDSAIQKSISIYIENPHNLAVMADKSMIGTVLRNLITNAVKYSHAGGKIVVSAEQKQDELLVAVCDTGIGIKKETIENLFRIDVSSTTAGTNNELGTGLGLLLCKEFVEKHGGKIWVESNQDGSTEDKGSEFYFTIPMK